MLLGELLALGVHAALDASLQFHRNSLGRTAVVTQIPAEHRAGEGRHSLDGLDHRNNLLVCQFFGFIVVMAVQIMEPVSLELYKTGTGHNSHTDRATAPTAQRTAINVVFGAAFVGVTAPELP